MTFEEVLESRKKSCGERLKPCADRLVAEALSKQIDKPVYWDMQDSEKPEAFCPACKRWLDWDAGSKFCPHCGQKLDWEVEEE